MNDRMWGHQQTMRNVLQLRSLGYRVVDPDSGDLAVGEGSGPGRMPEPETIVAHAAARLDSTGALTGKRVVVTAGPTREAVDPVRFLSNRSSGRMGVAIAEAAFRRGASVRLIVGPVRIPLPWTFPVELVESTADMLAAVQRALVDADALVMAAAPADFRPAEVATGKIKKSTAPDAIALVPTPDILRETIAERKGRVVTIGFALETDDVLANAREKLVRKALDLIVANDALEPGAGFEVETNRVTILAPDGTQDELPMQSKIEVAETIVDRLEELLRGR